MTPFQRNCFFKFFSFFCLSLPHLFKCIFSTHYFVYGVPYLQQFAVDNGDMWSPKRNGFILLLFILKYFKLNWIFLYLSRRWYNANSCSAIILTRSLAPQCLGPFLFTKSPLFMWVVRNIKGTFNFMFYMSTLSEKTELLYKRFLLTKRNYRKAAVPFAC